ncbi:GumC family protein [Flavihumibacter sp.]|uniref:GumC family protein n=1 Tax=Flavihumibacter sp. TaxID=1913981 RepID=UPI002FC6F0E8
MSNDFSYDPRESGSNIITIIKRKFLPYWPLLFLLVGVALVLANLYAKSLTPVYQISSSILIKDEKKGISESKMVESIDFFEMNKIVENEIEVLQSHTLMRKVVEDLGLYCTYYENGEGKLKSAYATVPVKMKLKEVLKSTEGSPIPFIINENATIVTINEKQYPVNQWVQTEWGNAYFYSAIRDSADLQWKNKKFYFTLVDPKVVENGLLAGLKVAAINKLATVVHLNMKDPDPRKGEDILNGLIKVYLQAEVDDKNQAALNTLASVEGRLDFVVGQLDSVENAIQKFRTRSGVIDISQQGRQYLDAIGMYDRQLQDINIKMSVLDEIENYVADGSNASNIMPSTIGVNDPALTQLMGRLNDAQLQFEKLKHTTGENSPVLLAVKDQIKQIRPSILDAVKNQKVNLTIAKSNLSTASSKYSSLLSSIPQKEKQLLEISRQQSIKNQIYSYLLQRREEAALSYSTTVGNTRVIDYARSSLAPVSPNRLLLMVIFSLLGIIAFIGFVFFKEDISSKMLFRKDIESISDYAVAGELWKHPGGMTGKKNSRVGQVVEEQVRLLRNQFFLSDIKADRSLLITSAVGGDGKSFLARKLASSLGAIGKKVLLIDFDTVNQKLTNEFNMSGRKGLADFLNKKATMEELVHSVDNDGEYYVLPAGTRVFESDELLVEELIPMLLKELETRFDNIIGVTAPLEKDTNMVLLSKHFSNTVFVLKQGHTPKAQAAHYIGRNQPLLPSGAKIIFNAVPKRGMGAWGEEFGYGYYYTTT